jgi:hypothetical protein
MKFAKAAFKAFRAPKRCRKAELAFLPAALGIVETLAPTPAGAVAATINLVNLSPGMAVTVEVKTGCRAILTYLLSPLLRYKQESLRER